MRPQHIDLPDATPKILGLDTNVSVFKISILTDGPTVEAALEEPDYAAPVWFTLSPDPYGVIRQRWPVRSLRLTGPGTVEILQQGLAGPGGAAGSDVGDVDPVEINYLTDGSGDFLTDGNANPLTQGT